ncbi:M20 metallopeptidase family protein [Blastopirellula retiformator]|uniref:N-acetyldiaminopimelate deacetylase n=1 Tax=Blastopirellula retiformator TaxID=2527970 RepID=A0A5C5UZ89_9BACT|nr:amidohydrolase [Blastopirellula retiformator]TWT30805.1 N-acetyldiaminopimelate deacetylase [Blastopirellula retiformator]
MTRRQIIPALLAAWIAVSIPALVRGETADQWVDQNLPQLMEIYKDLHSHPEVSFEEAKTAKKLASFLGDAGYEVTTDVGGHGVVAVLKNGDGPTLMLRCDMDGLPVTEQTELVYASQEKITTADGVTTGVMHACGHDIHMTNIIGVARYLASHRDLWQGTLVVICQPAEERGGGAKAMLEDGLLTRFPKPDHALALHVSATLPAGNVGYRAGYAMANVDSVDITVRGRGGHGAYPHTTIDPIVQASELVMSLQTIISREIKPIDPAVITIGSIHGGTKHNVIGDRCDLQLTVRSYGDKVRSQLRDAIIRRAKAIAQAYGAPEPTIVYSEGTPSLFNDQELAKQLVEVFRKTLGDDHVEPCEPSMGGEDFGRYGRAGVPILMFQLGSVDQKRLDRFAELGQPPPSLHSPFYYPDVEPTLKTGLRAMIAGSLDLLKAPPAEEQRN